MQKLQYLLQPSMMETKARGAVGARRGQMIEFLDLRKTHIDDRPARCAAARRSSRQAVQGLRAEHQIHERRALMIACALLACDAAADADDDFGPFAAFSARHWPSSENTFSCAFSRTEQVFMRRRSASAASCGVGQAAGRDEHVRHARGVVLVHLATEGLDEIAAGHGGYHAPRLKLKGNIVVEIAAAACAPTRQRSASLGPASARSRGSAGTGPA